MTNCDLASGGSCNRRQDYEQQPLPNSTPGKIDPVFPFPLLNLCGGSSRGGLRTKQRTCLYNDAVWSLNWLSGTAAWGLSPSRPAEQNEQDVAARLRRLVVTAPTSVGASAPGVDLAPYSSNLVSLPANLKGFCNLADLLPLDVRIFLNGEHKLMRRRKEETRSLVEDGGVARPCMDSALRHNKKRYLTFLRQLRSRSMLDFVERAKAWAGVFFVWKSSETTLRFIIHARSGNMFFKVPPAVGLCSSETFSRIEVERDDFWPFDEKPIPPGLSQVRMASVWQMCRIASTA